MGNNGDIWKDILVMGSLAIQLSLSRVVGLLSPIFSFSRVTQQGCPLAQLLPSIAIEPQHHPLQSRYSGFSVWVKAR